MFFFCSYCEKWVSRWNKWEFIIFWFLAFDSEFFEYLAANMFSLLNIVFKNKQTYFVPASHDVFKTIIHCTHLIIFFIAYVPAQNPAALAKPKCHWRFYLLKLFYHVLRVEHSTYLLPPSPKTSVSRRSPYEALSSANFSENAWKFREKPSGRALWSVDRLSRTFFGGRCVNFVMQRRKFSRGVIHKALDSRTKTCKTEQRSRMCFSNESEKWCIPAR